MYMLKHRKAYYIVLPLIHKLMKAFYAKFLERRQHKYWTQKLLLIQTIWHSVRRQWLARRRCAPKGALDTCHRGRARAALTLVAGRAIQDSCADAAARVVKAFLARTNEQLALLRLLALRAKRVQAAAAMLKRAFARNRYLRVRRRAREEKERFEAMMTEYRHHYEAMQRRKAQADKQKRARDMKRKEREDRVQSILARSLKDMGRSRSVLKASAAAKSGVAVGAKEGKSPAKKRRSPAKGGSPTKLKEPNHHNQKDKVIH